MFQREITSYYIPKHLQLPSGTSNCYESAPVDECVLANCFNLSSLLGFRQVILVECLGSFSIFIQISSTAMFWTSTVS